MVDRQGRRASDSSGDITRRELYFFNLYRLLEAVVYLGLILSPMAGDWLNIAHSGLGRTVAFMYCAVAVILVISTDQMRRHLQMSISVALAIDVVAASLVLFRFAAGTARFR